MAYQLTLTYNTSKSGASPASYGVSLVELDGRATGTLAQFGPVVDNVAIYHGMFASRREALQAALDYIRTPCMLVELSNPFSPPRIVVRPLGRQRSRDEFTSVATLASRTSRGVWIAA